MVKDLNATLDYIDRLDGLDTSDVEPMAQTSDRYGIDESKTGTAPSPMPCAKTRPARRWIEKP